MKGFKTRETVTATTRNASTRDRFPLPSEVPYGSTDHCIANGSLGAHGHDPSWSIMILRCLLAKPHSISTTASHLRIFTYFYPAEIGTCPNLPVEFPNLPVDLPCSIQSCSTFQLCFLPPGGTKIVLALKCAGMFEKNLKSTKIKCYCARNWNSVDPEKFYAIFGWNPLVLIFWRFLYTVPSSYGKIAHL